MAKIVKQYKHTRAVKAYAKKIAFAWHDAIEAILEAGRLLGEAHDRLGRKVWLDMVNNDLPFQRRTAEKLLKIAGDKRLTDRRNMKHLPPRWTTLHELTYLSDCQFKQAIKKRRIHPDMDRKEAELLTAGSKHKSTRKKQSVKTLGDVKSIDVNNSRKFRDVEVADLEAMDKNSIQLAVVMSRRQLSNEEAAKLDDELNKLSEEFGFLFSFSGYSSKEATKKGFRENLASAQQRWLEKSAEQFNIRHDIHRYLGAPYTLPGPEGDRMTKEEVIMVEEAIRQMENEKYPHKRRDGSFHSHDVRDPDNQFHEWYLAKSDPNVEWKPEEMYDFCRRGKIVTKYTPLSFVNYPAYLNSLAYLHSVGNTERRKDIEDELAALQVQEEYHYKRSNEFEYIENLAPDERKSYLKNRGLYDPLPLDFHPIWLATGRSSDMNWSVDIGPGQAKATLETLIR